MSNCDMIIPVGEELPPARIHVLAVTDRFRCLAQIDGAGRWVHVIDGRPVEEEVLGWIPLTDDRDLLLTPPPRATS